MQQTDGGVDERGDGQAKSQTDGRMDWWVMGKMTWDETRGIRSHVSLCLYDNNKSLSVKKKANTLSIN